LAILGVGISAGRRRLAPTNEECASVLEAHVPPSRIPHPSHMAIIGHYGSGRSRVKETCWEWYICELAGQESRITPTSYSCRFSGRLDFARNGREINSWPEMAFLSLVGHRCVVAEHWWLATAGNGTKGGPTLQRSAEAWSSVLQLVGSPPGHSATADFPKVVCVAQTGQSQVLEAWRPAFGHIRRSRRAHRPAGKRRAVPE
jgi:hypothetical protein